VLWFKNKAKNRRLRHRPDVLEVKVRSKVVRAARTRMAALSLGVLFGTVFGLYVLWRLGEWTLDQLVYENKSFAIREVDVQTDGVILPEQLRRWSGVRPGQNLLALDLARVKSDLELVPMVQSASVERILPGTLRVRVSEREPVAQVNVLNPRNGGGLEQMIFQLDAEGFVLLPLDPRQRMVTPGQGGDQLPVIAGINTSELQPGRRIDLPPVQSALKFIAAFEQSPMSGLVDLKRIDVSAMQVLFVTTEQGSEVTFAMDDFARQLGRWRQVYDECFRQKKTIATLDLAVNDYTPLRFVEASLVPPPVPKNLKPSRTRKKNV
jgi:cell division septal protein FtsQ